MRNNALEHSNLVRLISVPTAELWERERGMLGEMLRSAQERECQMETLKFNDT